MAKNDNRLQPSEETPPAASPAVNPVPAAAATGWAQVLMSLRWPLALVAVGLIGYLAYRDTLATASNAASTAARTMTGVASGFYTGNVTEKFLSSIPEFDAEGSGNLEVATLTATETISHSDERKILWDQISLGVATSEIRVPVTYRYHLRLRDEWQVTIKGTVCTVRAPIVRPSLPPAIHTDGMEKRSDLGWLRFDGADHMTELEQSITPTLETFAADERHQGVVRENARREVRAFVRTWLLREDQWGEQGVQAIRVIFTDEADEEAEGSLELEPLEIRRPKG